MATYHCTVRAGSKGKAGPHAAYISRTGKYADLRYGEKLEASEHGNMPTWAMHDADTFWKASDEYERANGSTYREIEVALPRELTPEQRLILVRDFVRQEFGSRHAYSFAIHNPEAALDKGEQPHAHIMFSERLIDGVHRDPDQYFKRYNSKEPGKGGCRKVSGGKTAAERRAELVALRERWATVQNKHLAGRGHSVRVDHRTLLEQGIERGPEPHFGPRKIKLLKAQDVSALLSARIAEGEKERADKAVRASIIDMSADIAAAKQDREKRLSDQAARSALDDSERVKRVQSIPSLLQRAGVAYLFGVNAKRELDFTGGDASRVNWKGIEARVMRDAMVEHGQTADDVLKALLSHSPARCDAASQAELRALVQKHGPGFAAQYEQRQASNDHDSGYGPGMH